MSLKVTARLKRVYNAVGNTYTFVDASGIELVGVVVAEETVFTATANDIRKGTVAVTEDGVTTGTKVIPTYHTTEGYKLIPKGSEFKITNVADLDRYDYTRLMAIICPYTGSIAKSVSAERVVINDGVYAVNSTDILSTVVKDSENKEINIGMINESGSIYLLRYFTYKEID